MTEVNWQLFFQDLDRRTTNQVIRENEVLSLARGASDSMTITDSINAAVGAPTSGVDFSSVDFSVVG